MILRLVLIREILITKTSNMRYVLHLENSFFSSKTFFLRVLEEFKESKSALNETSYNYTILKHSVT